jgi:WD40 repeat protein
MRVTALALIVMALTLVGSSLAAEPAKSEPAKPAPAAKAVPAAAATAKTAAATPKINYAEHIQPIFREHCYSCHSQDTAKSDLALDSYAAAMRGGAGGEVVLAGDLESSRLWMLISHQETPKMPPEQDKLAEAKLALVKQWILEGALESAGSKAKAKPKTNLELKVTGGSAKPSGPPPMPSGLGREPYVYTPRAGAVTAIAASPWAPLVAIAGQKQVLLYNSDTGELLGVLPFPEGRVQVLKFSRNGSILLAGGGRGGQSGRVVLFDVKTGKRVGEVGDELDVVLAADINDDHTLVALGGPRRIVRVYSVAEGTVEYEIRKHTDWIYALEFSPDGVLLATADRSAGLFVWEADTGREFQNLTGHTAGVTDVSWRSDANLLASSSEDGTIRLWEMDNGKQVKSWPAHSGGTTAVMYARDGRLVSAGRDNQARLWDGNGKNLKAFGPFSDQVLEATITHDGGRVVAGDWTGEIRLYGTADGALVTRLLENPPTLAMLIEGETQRAGQFEAEAKKLAVEVEQSDRAAKAAAAATQAAATQAQAAAAELKRLQALRPQLEKSIVDKTAAGKQAHEALAALRAAAAKVQADETPARRAANHNNGAWRAAVDRVAKLDQEVARAADKLQAAKKSLAAKQAQLDGFKPDKAAAAKDESQGKKLANDVADLQRQVKSAEAAWAAATEKKTAAAKPIDKLLAEKNSADKLLAEKVAATKQASDKVAQAQAAARAGDQERAALSKSLSETTAALKAATAKAPQYQAAVDKARGAQAAVEKALADKRPAVQAAITAAAAAKASAERARQEKAQLEKLRTAQANAPQP